jgi:hypothetical protein
MYNGYAGDKYNKCTQIRRHKRTRDGKRLQQLQQRDDKPRGGHKVIDILRIDRGGDQLPVSDKIVVRNIYIYI